MREPVAGGSELVPILGEGVFCGDPYIVHLNIALEMVASSYFGGKSHVSNGCNMHLFRSPVLKGSQKETRISDFGGLNKATANQLGKHQSELTSVPRMGLDWSEAA